MGLQFFTSTFVALHDYSASFLKPVVKRLSKSVHAPNALVVLEFCISKRWRVLKTILAISVRRCPTKAV